MLSICGCYQCMTIGYEFVIKKIFNSFYMYRSEQNQIAYTSGIQKCNVRKLFIS